MDRLQEFKDEAEHMCDEYDALLVLVEAYGRQVRRGYGRQGISIIRALIYSRKIR